jgi:hypothetical protein
VPNEKSSYRPLHDRPLASVSADGVGDIFWWYRSFLEGVRQSGVA